MSLTSGKLVSGTISTADRAGAMASPILSPFQHPFRVQCHGVENGEVHFSVHEGNVFTGTGTGQSLVQIDDETISIVETVTDPTTLTNGNQPCTYKASISAGEPTILYVRIRRTLDNPEWEQQLVVKTQTQMVNELNVEAPYFASDPEVFEAADNSHGFPSTITIQRQHCGLTYTVTMTQQGKRYKTTYSWFGAFQYPVAMFVSTGNEVFCTQILRSDIFFPFTREMTTRYVDTGVNSLGFGVQGECPCGGCGCGCGGGCCGGECGGGCCGGGCCGTGCGCGCGCGCAPDLPPPLPPSLPIPPGPGNGSGPGGNSNGGANYVGMDSYVVDLEYPGTRGEAQVDDFSGPFPIYGPVAPKPASAFPLPNGTAATPGTPGTERATFRIAKFRYERIPGTAPDQSPASFTWVKISAIHTVVKMPVTYGVGTTFSNWPPA